MLPQFLDHCATKRVIHPDNFEPTDKPHKTCMFNSIQFDSIAYDFMETEYFKKNFGDGYFMIYVNKVCPHCGEVKLDEYGEEIRYLKLVRDNAENRNAFGFDNTEDESD